MQLVPVIDAQVIEPPLRLAQHPPGIPAGGASGGAEHHQGIDRYANQRRGEHRIERLLVARVGERP